MDTIKHQLNLFIIPFVYTTIQNEDKFFENEVVSKIDQMKIEKKLNNKQNASVWIPIKDKSENRFFEHINQLVPKYGGNCVSTIGKLWNLNPLARELFGLPKDPNNIVMYHTSKKKNIILKISDVQLYLFETGIGFLIYEIDYPKINKMEEVIFANYTVKRLRNFGGSMHLLKKNKIQKGDKENKNIENEEEYEIKSSFADLTKALLEPLNVISYFGSDKELPKHALVFNTTILDENFSKSAGYLDRLKQYVFETRRVFKESYIPNQAELEFNKNSEVFKPFENSVWGVSLEGASNIVFHTDNDATNKFFSQSYISNIKMNYFYMYILGLHQHYALLNLSVRAAEIPRKMDTLIDSEGAFEAIKELREDIAYFDLRSSFLHVSHITHQNKVYQYIYRNLYIGDLHAKLQSEVESIASLLDIRKSAIEKRNKQLEDEKLRKKDNFFVGITTMFVVISTSSSVWSLCNAFLSDSREEKVFWYIVGGIVFVAALGIMYKSDRFHKSTNILEKNK